MKRTRFHIVHVFVYTSSHKWFQIISPVSVFQNTTRSFSRRYIPVVHAYGTNGIVTQVELPLARAQAWWDAVATFPTLKAAAAFALDVGEAPALVVREVSVHQAPTFAHLLRDTPLGKRLAATTTATGDGGDDGGPCHHHEKHVVLVQIAGKSGFGPLSRLAKDVGGEVRNVVHSYPTGHEPP